MEAWLQYKLHRISKKSIPPKPKFYNFWGTLYIKGNSNYFVVIRCYFS